MARQSAHNVPEADEKVIAILDSAKLSIDDILERARVNRAEKLAKGYAERNPSDVKQVTEFFDAAGRTMEDLLAGALAEELDFIERIDRMISIAETRRNASLHAIDRRRTVLGAALRQSVQEVEDADFEEIETLLANGKSAEEGSETRSAANRTNARGGTGPKTVQPARRRITTERPRVGGRQLK